MATFNVGPYNYQSPYNPNRYQVQGSPYSYVGVNPWAAALLDNTPATTTQNTWTGTPEGSGDYGSGANSDNPGATGGGKALGDMSMSELNDYANDLANPNSAASMMADLVGPIAMGITGNLANSLIGLGIPTTREDMQAAVQAQMNKSIPTLPAAPVAGVVTSPLSVSNPATSNDIDYTGPTTGTQSSSGPAAGPGVAGADTSGTSGSGTGVGPGTGVGTEADAGNSGDNGSCVIATYLTETGAVPFSMKRDWVRYCITQKHGSAIGEAQRRGYLTWARPLVKALRRSQTATKVFAYLGQRYADHISGRGSVIGAIIKYTLEPISTLIGMVKR